MNYTNLSQDIALGLRMRIKAISASVCFGVALLVFSEGLPNRFGTNTCTLRAELDQPCQLRSSLDAISKSGKDEGFGGLYMLLGETECTVTLQKCRPGTCYSIRDLTAMLPTDIGIVRASSSLFRDIKVVAGAQRTAVTREGFAFQATARNVTLLYSTRTCADFWQLHGQHGQLLCNQPIEAITAIGSDGPASLPCP